MTDNQVTADLIALIKTGLSGFAPWQVVQSYQPTRGHFSRPYILIHRLGETALGYLQTCSFKPENGGQIIQSTWQIDAVRYSRVQDDVTTPGAGDVLKRLRNWFMSDAAARELRAKGYNVLRVGEIATPQIETETETFQILPNFTLDLIYKQTYEQQTPDITSAKSIIKGV
ncbi:MAG: phage gateway protein [Candidatus Avelusimicrobium sp.]|uniref:phage gateway protein n=1 Tax=Candidatus Avelusimicrobium sp. TaxID=3048833 RepID=UPI003F0F00F7